MREQVYETLKKHCSGYENANEIQKQLYCQPSSNTQNIQQPIREVPKHTNRSVPLQSQNVNNHRPTATNITGITGFASPLNARKQQEIQAGIKDFTITSKNDAMALYARVDRTKKKKNRDSGGGSR